MVKDNIAKCRAVMKEYKSHFVVHCANQYKEHYLQNGLYNHAGKRIKILADDYATMDDIELHNSLTMILESYPDADRQDSDLPIEGDIMYRMMRFMYITIHSPDDPLVEIDDDKAMDYCKPFFRKYSKWYCKLARTVAYGILDLLNGVKADEA